MSKLVIATQFGEIVESDKQTSQGLVHGDAAILVPF